MEANHLLQQATSWSPLDLSQDPHPVNVRAANDGGPGILPDVGTRPELSPVQGPLPVAGHSDPAAPWE